MEPLIDSVRFGAITVAGQTVKHDIIIALDGHVQKRPKHLSKQLYGTSHMLSLKEVQAVWEEGADTLIVGAGVLGRVRLSDDAQAFLAQNRCTVRLYPIRRAVQLWNASQGQVIGLFHITC
jgi:hypothetical protein